MNVKTAAQGIRDTVTMDRILDLYGYKSKRGFMCCPFHGEKEPSLKIYGGTKGWHCFGCNRGGSVIDFVMEQEGCDFRTAVIAIDQALNLGFTDPHENPIEADRQKRIQTSLDHFVEAVYAYCDAIIKQTEHQRVMDYQRLKELETLKAVDKQKISADDWTFMLTWEDEEQYQNYKVEKIQEFKEVVAAWRRKLRKVQ